MSWFTTSESKQSVILRRFVTPWRLSTTNRMAGPSHGKDQRRGCCRSSFSRMTDFLESLDLVGTTLPAEACRDRLQSLKSTLSLVDSRSSGHHRDESSARRALARDPLTVDRM